MASGLPCGPQQEKQEEMGPEARFSCVYNSVGDLKVAVYPSSPALPPSLLRFVGQRHSVRLRADFSHSWECWVVWRPVYTGAWTS